VSVITSGLVKLFFNSVIAACKSAWPNELIKSPEVGVADAEGDGRALVTSGEDEIGAGACAKMDTARINVVKLASQNRSITVILRAYLQRD
jgi:hypothetical protein